jgi:hypothetical protein
MSIYKDYDIEDVLFDLPCIIDNINIYSVKITKWKQFQKYIPYLIMSKEHYKLAEDQSLLMCAIVNMMQVYNNNEYPQDEELKLKLLHYILKELCDLFSIVTRTNISYEENKELGYCFVNHDKDIQICENNFDILRRVILKQNILFEPIIYKSKFKEKWARSVARGRAKNSKSLSLAEIISIVRGGLKISYEEINNLNIFQLYVDYYRLDNTKSFETITLLKTTYGMDWGQLPNINYTDAIIDKLLRNPELDYFKDFDMGEVTEALK